MPSLAEFTIGLISDTHGLLRAEAVETLRGCDAIIHAGDIGSPQVLGGLSQLAPTTAVRQYRPRRLGGRSSAKRRAGVRRLPHLHPA